MRLLVTEVAKKTIAEYTLKQAGTSVAQQWVPLDGLEVAIGCVCGKYLRLPL